MTERPILFSGAMVRAILAGRKTQTRRVLALRPDEGVYGIGMSPIRAFVSTSAQPTGYRQIRCPYAAEIGDRLWVRETWSPWADEKTRSYLQDRGTGPNGERGDPRADLPALYRADYAPDLSSLDAGGCEKWRPSIHMPRAMARLFLEVTSVRVERLQSITEEGARAEGFPLPNPQPGRLVVTDVWVVSFRKVD